MEAPNREVDRLVRHILAHLGLGKRLVVDGDSLRPFLHAVGHHDETGATPDSPDNQ